MPPCRARGAGGGRATACTGRAQHSRYAAPAARLQAPGAAPYRHRGRPGRRRAAGPESLPHALQWRRPAAPQVSDRRLCVPLQLHAQLHRPAQSRHMRAAPEGVRMVGYLRVSWRCTSRRLELTLTRAVLPPAANAASSPPYWPADLGLPFPAAAAATSATAAAAASSAGGMASAAGSGEVRWPSAGMASAVLPASLGASGLGCPACAAPLAAPPPAV